eukprot:1395559-Amorphochlora_amoeboformis.AAC.1
MFARVEASSNGTQEPITLNHPCFRVRNYKVNRSLTARISNSPLSTFISTQTRLTARSFQLHSPHRSVISNGTSLIGRSSQLALASWVAHLNTRWKPFSTL